MIRARTQGRTCKENGEAVRDRPSEGQPAPTPPPRTKSLEPVPRGVGNSSPVHSALVAFVEKIPDAIVADLAAAFEACSGTSMSRSEVQRALGRLGVSRRRCSTAVERDTAEHRESYARSFAWRI